MSDAGWVALAPFVVLAVLFGLSIAVTGSANVYRLAEGADGRTSTSKMQFLLWTVVALACYAAVFVANWRAGHVDVSLGVPTNLLAALGLSITTAAGAKALYLVGSAPKTIKGEDDKGGLLTDDGGNPDLAKLQLIGWTLLAIALFCVRVAHHVQGTLGAGEASTTLPNVDTALLVLMGLGHAGYGAKKALDRVAPRSQPLEPANPANVQPAQPAGMFVREPSFPVEAPLGAAGDGQGR